MYNWREDSIKTRIETWGGKDPKWSQKIEEKIPLKQGLKLNESRHDLPDIDIEEKIPLKQGLKHSASIILLFASSIEEKIPH